MKDLYTIINKLIHKQTITSTEATELVHTYVTTEIGQEPTTEELRDILKALNMGIFSVDYMLNTIIRKPLQYGLYTCTVYSTIINEEGDRSIIRTILYKV